MKEQAPRNKEHSVEHHEQPAHETKHRQPHAKHEQPMHTENSKDTIEEILTKIEQEASAADQIQSEVHNSENEQTSDTHAAIPINSSLKKHGLNQTLRKIQRKLPASQRGFSKVIHQPAIEQISDVAGATIARPSGILAAGFFSFVTSIAVLLLCRYYGYEYNFTIGLMALVGGFLLGLLLELVLRATSRQKSR